MHADPKKNDEERDARGEWRPSDPAAYAPLFAWPARPKLLLTWLFGDPGYLRPYNLFHVALAILTWFLLQPALENCVTLKPGWIGMMLLRNAIFMWIIYGGLHLILYKLKLHGKNRKYLGAWQATHDPRFLFNNQVHDNIFRSFIIGCPIWTAYEVLYMWGLANAKLPFLAWDRNPIWFVGMFLVIPIWRELHFYTIHRMLHWRPLYKHVHKVHHLNTNPGPWAGMAMHWFELIGYLSVVLIHFIVPSHPIHFLFNAQLTALTPAYGHHGFDGPLFEGKFPTGSYFHYLHHRHVSCNFGESTLPLDRWFGTFYNGKGSYRQWLKTRHNQSEPQPNETQP
jgi:sterol desaturase/sphingolipid hydroxylase (fatty acid hydroxylase superfamily)